MLQIYPDRQLTGKNAQHLYNFINQMPDQDVDASVLDTNSYTANVLNDPLAPLNAIAMQFVEVATHVHGHREQVLRTLIYLLYRLDASRLERLTSHVRGTVMILFSTFWHL
jgi:hypothetical protein